MDMVAFLTLWLFARRDMGRSMGVRDGLAALLKEFFEVSVAGHALRAGNHGLRRRFFVAALAGQARLLMSLDTGGWRGRLPGVMKGYCYQGTNECENDEYSKKTSFFSFPFHNPFLCFTLNILQAEIQELVKSAGIPECLQFALITLEELTF